MFKRLKTLTLCFLLLSSLRLFSSQVHIDFNSPVYEDGVISTSQGGVIEAPNLRIQAKHIVFDKNKHQGLVKAKGDVWINYHGKHFVGEQLVYYFDSKSGWIEKGRTRIGNWYFFGEKIAFEGNEHYEYEGFSMSTCEMPKPLWELKVKKGCIQNKEVVSAKNIQLKILHIPVFWMPYFRANVKALENLLAKYEFITGGTVGERIAVRYQLASLNHFTSYLQGDYWFSRGPDLSLQWEYNNPSIQTSYLANNFIAFDYHGAHPYGTFRNRFVGKIKSTPMESLEFFAQYDKLSDDNVLETYFNRDYFLQIERRTQMHLRYTRPNWLAFLRTEVRINPFDIVSQELPSFLLSARPYQLDSFPLIADFSLSAGYYDYVFGNIIPNSPENFRSPRVELHPKVYMPLQLGPFAWTSLAEYIGIGYGQSLIDKPLWNSLGHLSSEVNLPIEKTFSCKWKHVFIPYTSYTFYSRPTVSFSDHYLFNEFDSYVKLNQLRWGIKNLLYYKAPYELLVPLNLDIYAYGFFNNQTIGSYLPKIYVDLSTHLSDLYVRLWGAYNFQHDVIDYSNARIAWTFNEYFAISCQFMHRSRYDYKKANPDNFFLDVFRPQAQLLSSPLSDRRNTFLTSLYFRPHHRLIFEFRSRTGWNRQVDPYYNEVFFITKVLLPCNWIFSFMPRKTVPEGWRWEFKIELGPKPPEKPEKNFIFW